MEKPRYRSSQRVRYPSPCRVARPQSREAHRWTAGRPLHAHRRRIRCRGAERARCRGTCRCARGLLAHREPAPMPREHARAALQVTVRDAISPRLRARGPLCSSRSFAHAVRHGEHRGRLSRTDAREPFRCPPDGYSGTVRNSSGYASNNSLAGNGALSGIKRLLIARSPLLPEIEWISSAWGSVIMTNSYTARAWMASAHSRAT